MGKEIVNQVQEAHRVPYRINPRRNMPKHTLIKLTKTKHKEKILKDITIVNIYAPNIGAPQYVRQTLTDIKEEIDSNTIVVGNFNTPLTPMDRSSKHKINKEIQVLNDTLDDMDLIDIFRMFHPNEEGYTFFSSAHGTFLRINYIFCNHNAMRLDIDYKKEKKKKKKKKLQES